MSGQHHSSRLFFWMALAIAIGSLAGCGSGGPETVSVRGQVTYGNEACPGGGTIYFAPVSPASPDLPQRPATADFEADGSFRVTSYAKNDGLVPGTYRVRIECWLTRTQGYNTPGEHWGPGNYDVPVRLVIESGSSTVRPTFDIPKR